MDWLRCIISITCVAYATSFKNLPNNILRRLRYVKNWETFISIFNIRVITDHTTDDRIRMFGNVVTLENECCKLRPVITEVPQSDDPNSFHYPFYVTLYRCLGSCDKNPFGLTCKPIVKEEVYLRVPVISWMSNHIEDDAKLKYIPFFNHTECGCRCLYDKSACNRFQDWDEHRCKCKCRTCPSEYFTEHPSECCVCKTKMKCPHRQKWSPEKCACVCKKTKKCRNPDKVRDPSTCKCRCDPRIQCRYGTMNHQTCNCRARLFG